MVRKLKLFVVRHANNRFEEKVMELETRNLSLAYAN